MLWAGLTGLGYRVGAFRAGKGLGWSRWRTRRGEMTEKQRQPSSGGEAGFTLIELLAVLAILSTLISLLVPAIQSVRQAAASAAAKQKLTKISLEVTSDWTLILPQGDFFDPQTALTLGFKFSNTQSPVSKTFYPCSDSPCGDGGAEIQGSFTQVFSLDPEDFQTAQPFSVDAVASFNPGGKAQGAMASLSWTGTPELRYDITGAPELPTYVMLCISFVVLGYIGKSYRGRRIA
jgi:prepilin-type N-terminal cleavage/methylation domain-containing protein